MVQVNLQHVVEAGLHDAFQAVINVLCFPEQVLFVLDPFEVGNGYAPGVAKNIGNDENAFGFQDPVCFGSQRAVGRFTDDLGMEAGGVVLLNRILEGGRDQYFAFHGEQLRR